MTALSTHDTKRGEDVRARIAVLAEAPELWADALASLLELAPLPDRGFANLLWQAAFGAWPISADRLHAYAEKAMREAGDRTTWTDARRGVRVGRARRHRRARHSNDAMQRVLDDLVARLDSAARSNSLALKLLALTLPGVPDVYQGSEIEERSLVDPDNRRPVDFDAAIASLADGSNTKQTLTAEALRLRRDRPELFTGVHPAHRRGSRGRPRARLRPGWGGHRGHPAAARAREEGRLGGHGAAAPRGDRAASTSILVRFARPRSWCYR